MAVLSITNPGKVVFSKNPAVFSVATDGYVEDAGTACFVQVSLPGGTLTTGETFTFVWDGNSVTLTVDSDPTVDPDEYGAKVGTDSSYFAFALRGHKLLSDDFVIYQTGTDCYLLAREKGTAKSLTVTSSDGGVSVTVTDAGTDPVINADLRLIGTLYIAGTTGITETFHTRFNAIFDLNNVAKFDLSDKLHSMLECEDVIGNTEGFSERVKSHKRYILRVAENTSPGSVEQGDVWVTRGGLKFQDDVLYPDFFTTYFLADQIYLTNKGDRKVHRFQKESLAIICPAGNEVDATVMITVADTTGATYDYTGDTIPLSRYRKYSFACGQVELDVINTALANGLADVDYWEVSLRSSDGGIDLGRGRKFYLVQKGALDRVFTFENAMGWFDTVTCSGEMEAMFKVEKDEFEKLFPFWNTNLNRSKNIQQKTNYVGNINKAFSGYMELADLYVWMEFLASENVWLQDENISTQFFNAVNIDKGSFKMWRDDDYRYAIEFEWSYAMRDTNYSKVPFV